MNDISLKQLEIFVAVVEYGGFTRAAEELFFNQSTVSAHISLLEQALGKELFVRSNRRHVRLTKEGEQVYPIARRILNDCAALRTLFSDADSAPVVALGASTVPGQYLVPGYLAAFLKREPEFRYSLRRGDSEQVHRMLVLFEYAQQLFGVIRIRARAVDPAEIIAGLRHRHCGCALDVRPCLRHDHAVARAVQRTHRRDGRAVFSIRHKRCFHLIITAVFLLICLP